MMKAERIIRSCMSIAGIFTVKALAEKCGYVRQTLSNKIHKPRTMTCGELADIAKEIRMTDADIAEFIRGCMR